MPKKENPLRQLPASSDEYGTFKIHLAELMEQRGVSMNQLSFRRCSARSFAITGMKRFSGLILIF